MTPEAYRLTAELQQTHWWFVARRQVLCGLIEQLVPAGQETLLVEVGCGCGGNVEALRQRYRAVGIDPDPLAIRLAQDRFPSGEFLTGRVPEAIPQPDEVRLFLLADVLEHIEDDRQFLARLVEAASPGTYFLITVPADPSLWSRHDEVHGHFRRYAPERLAELWCDTPLEVLLFSWFNTRLYPLVRWVRRRQRPGASHGESGTDLKLPWWPVNAVLRSVLAGEATRLVAELREGEPTCRPGCGVSLIAALRKSGSPRQQSPGVTPQ